MSVLLLDLFEQSSHLALLVLGESGLLPLLVVNDVRLESETVELVLGASDDLAGAVSVLEVLHGLQVLHKDQLLEAVEEADRDTLTVRVGDEAEEGLVLRVCEGKVGGRDMVLEGKVLKEG